MGEGSWRDTHRLQCLLTSVLTDIPARGDKCTPIQNKKREHPPSPIRWERVRVRAYFIFTFDTQPTRTLVSSGAERLHALRSLLASAGNCSGRSDCGFPSRKRNTRQIL